MEVGVGAAREAGELVGEGEGVGGGSEGQGGRGEGEEGGEEGVRWCLSWGRRCRLNPQARERIYTLEMTLHRRVEEDGSETKGLYCTVTDPYSTRLVFEGFLWPLAVHDLLRVSEQVCAQSGKQRSWET